MTDLSCVPTATNCSVSIVNSPILSYGEAPHWDIERQSLYFVDLFASRSTILRYDFQENKTYKAEIEHCKYTISFIIPVQGAEDEFAISLNGNVCIIKWNGVSETATIIRTAIAIETGNRLNDAKADPCGRLVCGIMPNRGIEDIFCFTNDGNLYRYAKNEQKVLIETEISLPNGLTWDINTNKFYYIDSLAYDLKEYDYDLKSGNISNVRKVVDFRTKYDDRPTFLADGLTIDENGHLYAALFNGFGVIKIDPRSKTIIEFIKLPVPQVTSLAFGGPNLDILYVTTGAQGIGTLPPESGGLFQITGLPVKGVKMQKVRV